MVLKKYLVNCIHERRKGRQKGIITELVSGSFDPDADFIKVGKGSLGGKARGLAFISTQLKQHPDFQKKYENIDIQVPKSLVLSTEGCDSFIITNNLQELATSDLNDPHLDHNTRLGLLQGLAQYKEPPPPSPELHAGVEASLRSADWVTRAFAVRVFQYWLSLQDPLWEAWQIRNQATLRSLAETETEPHVRLLLEAR